MKWKPLFWRTDGRGTGLEWAWCAAWLVPCVWLAWFQCDHLWKVIEENTSERKLVCEMEAANLAEESRLSSELGEKSLLYAQAESVLGGLFKAGRDTPETSALGSLPLREEGGVQGDQSSRAMSFTGDLEYHAFVPALNRQEACSPLMRCRRLLLKATGAPFHTSALQLHIDLEVAFPWQAQEAAELAGNTGDR